MKKQIIFDMDGTLSDTGKATLTAIRALEGKFQLPTVDISHIRNAMGIAGLEFHRAIFPSLSEDVLIRLEPEVDALEYEAIQALGASILFPGVMKLLAELSRAGHKLHIASTGSSTHVQGTLSATGIGAFITSVSCGAPEKITMVKRIIAGTDPRGWVMVGDMYKDSEAARGNNILALGAGYGYLAREDYGLFDGVLNSPDDVWAYLKV